MEVGIQCQGTPEQGLRTVAVTKLELDHPCVEIEQSIARARRERLLHSLGGITGPAILVEYPR